MSGNITPLAANQQTLQSNALSISQPSGICSTTAKVVGVITAVLVTIVGFILLKPLFAGIITLLVIGFITLMSGCCLGSSSGNIGRINSTRQNQMNWYSYFNPSNLSRAFGGRNVYLQAGGRRGSRAFTNTGGSRVFQNQGNLGRRAPAQQYTNNRIPQRQQNVGPRQAVGGAGRVV